MPSSVTRGRIDGRQRTAIIHFASGLVAEIERFYPARVGVAPTRRVWIGATTRRRRGKALAGTTYASITPPSVRQAGAGRRAGSSPPAPASRTRRPRCGTA